MFGESFLAWTIDATAQPSIRVTAGSRYVHFAEQIIWFERASLRSSRRPASGQHASRPVVARISGLVAERRVTLPSMK
jgi:hypothetical protein